MSNLYDWSKAPSWAAYGATDEDGGRWWYEKEPVLKGSDWVVGPDGGKYDRMFRELSPLDSLERRP